MPVAVVPARVLVGKTSVVTMSTAPTLMLSVLVLLVRVISGVLVATVAVPVMVVPVAVPGTNTWIVVTVVLPALPLALSVPKLTVICWPVDRVTVVMTLLAVPAPRLLTVTVALTVVPGCALAGRSKVTLTSANATVKVAVEMLLVVLGSAVVLVTWAVLVTTPLVAVPACTVSVIVTVVPAFRLA